MILKLRTPVDDFLESIFNPLVDRFLKISCVFSCLLGYQRNKPNNTAGASNADLTVEVTAVTHELRA